MGSVCLSWVGLGHKPTPACKNWELLLAPETPALTNRWLAAKPTGRPIGRPARARLGNPTEIRCPIINIINIIIVALRGTDKVELTIVSEARNGERVHATQCIQRQTHLSELTYQPQEKKNEKPSD